MKGELAQVQWVSLHMQGASFPLHPLPPCPNPNSDEIGDDRGNFVSLKLLCLDRDDEGVVVRQITQRDQQPDQPELFCDEAHTGQATGHGIDL